MVEFCTETSTLSDYPCVFYCVIVQSYCSFCVVMCSILCIIINILEMRGRAQR